LPASGRSSAIEVTTGRADVTALDVTVETEMSDRTVIVELPVLPGPRLDISRPDVAEAARVAALIGDPVRAGILAILRDGPHCVCEMAAALEVRQNNLSNHLARLREAGLVRTSRHQVDARWVYYERDEEALAAASAALARIV
jgi:DNA-binding transcriptional ArsR family regulator